jgi:hypothetical protein
LFFNFIPWHLIFISDLVLNPLLNFFSISSPDIWFLYQILSSFFWLLFLFFSYLLINWIFCFNYISYDLILSSFYVKFDSHSFHIYIFFLLSLFKFFFMFIPNYFYWLRILRCYYFRFAIYTMIQPHESCHKFWRFDWVDFGLFYFILFCFIPFIIIRFVGNWYSLFFYLFFLLSYPDIISRS